MLLTNCAQIEQRKSADSTVLTKAEIPNEAEAEAETREEKEEQISEEIPDQAVQSFRQLIATVTEAIDTGRKPVDEREAYMIGKVKHWLNYFTIRDRERFQRYLDRGQKYKEVVQTMLEENGIPNELYYMAMIESGYSTHAFSRARAVGVWQFIRPTGQRYGLKSNYYVDERRDPIMATEGATKYLRELYNAFLSWELAMAAYNTGELRVLKAIMKGKSRNFWDIAKARRIPRETRNYVPKFIAATMIGTNFEKYGFLDPARDYDPYPSVVAVEVPSRVRLRDIARASGVSEKTIRSVNQHLRRGMTPPTRGKYEIWVPEQYAKQVRNAGPRLQSKRIAMKEIYDTPMGGHSYKVRPGDTLSQIAQRHRMSIRSLKRLNGLVSSRIYPGMKLRISAKSYKRPASGGSTYVVRRGDNLGLVAKRYGMSVAALKRINGLRSDRIRVGQRLILSAAAKKSKNRTPADKGQKYRVRRGDTLEGIARRHGLTIKKLKSLNGIRRNRIYVGEILKISSL